MKAPATLAAILLAYAEGGDKNVVPMLSEMFVSGDTPNLDFFQTAAFKLQQGGYLSYISHGHQRVMTQKGRDAAAQVKQNMVSQHGQMPVLNLIQQLGPQCIDELIAWHKEGQGAKPMDATQYQEMMKMFAMLAAGVNRIADALEAHSERDEDQIVTLPLSDYRTFDWATINARVIYTDADGVASVAGADGKIYKRRSNQKFGNEIWYSRGDGKNEDNTPNYKTLVRFVDMKPEDVMPLGRNVVAAASKAAPTPTTTAPKQAHPETIAVPVAPTQPAKYKPSADERKTVSALLDYALLMEKAKTDELQRNHQAIVAKWESVCKAATLRGIAEGEKPAGLGAAVRRIKTLADACAKYDEAQPEMQLA